MTTTRIELRMGRFFLPYIKREKVKGRRKGKEFYERNLYMLLSCYALTMALPAYPIVLLASWIGWQPLLMPILIPVYYIGYLAFMVLLTFPVYRVLSKDRKYFPVYSTMYRVVMGFFNLMPGMNHPFFWLLPLYGLKKGRNCVCFGTLLNPEMVELGDDVVIGLNALVTPHFVDRGVLIMSKIKIGNNVSIGAYGGVGPGAIIENDVIIAPAALVPPNKHLPEGTIWMQSPSIPTHPATEEEVAEIRRASGGDF